MGNRSWCEFIHELAHFRGTEWLLIPGNTKTVTNSGSKRSQSLGGIYEQDEIGIDDFLPQLCFARLTPNLASIPSLGIETDFLKDMDRNILLGSFSIQPETSARLPIESDAALSENLGGKHLCF